MFACLFVALFISLAYGESDPCDFTQSEFLSKEEVEECFKVQEWDKNLVDDLFDSLDKYLDASQFTEALKAPPTPYENLKFDQKAELQALKEKAKNQTHEYKVHFDLVDFYKKAHDPHQVYFPPDCFELFVYFLPFGPKIEDGESGQRIVLQNLTHLISEIISERVTNIEEEYEKFINNHNTVEYTGFDNLSEYAKNKYEVVTINGDDPAVFYEKLFDISGHSKDKGSVINTLDRYQLFSGNTSGGLNFNQIKMTVRADANDSNPTEIIVPYIYLSIVDPKRLNSESFKNYCSTNILPYVSNEVASFLKQLKSTKSGIMVDYKKIFKYIFEQYRTQNDIESSQVDKKEENNQISNGKYNIELIGEGEGFYEVLLITEQNNNDGEKVGLLILKTFAPEGDNVDSEIAKLRNDLVKLKDRGITKLVIDVRGNGGGYVILSSIVLSWLNGKAETYTQFIYRKRRNEVADAILKLTNKEFQDFYTHENVSVKDILKTSEYIHHTSVTKNGDGTTEKLMFPVEYTQQFTVESFMKVENGHMNYYSDLTKPIFNLGREDILILGDGVGGSATGMFMWGASQLMIARTVSVGGLGDKFPAGFASFTGATVIDSTAFEGLFAGSKKNDLYPKPLPHGAIVRVPYLSAFSYDKPGLLQEFRHAAGDYHINYLSKTTMSSSPDYRYDYSESNLLDKIMELWNNYDKLNKNESIWPDLIKETSIVCQDDDPTTVYGHYLSTKDTNSQYTGGCGFLHCADLYYYDYNTSTCLPIIDSSDINGGGMSTTEICLCIFMVIFLLGFIAMTVLYILKVRKVSQNKSGAGVTQEMNID